MPTPGTTTREATRGLHPWQGETNLNYTGPKPPYDLLGGGSEILLAEVAALGRDSGGSRPAGAGAGDVCGGPAQTKELVDHGAEGAGRPAHGGVFHARPDGGARHRDQGLRRSDASSSTTNSSRRSRPATRRPSTARNGNRPLGRRMRRASASWRRRAAHWAIGW